MVKRWLKAAAFAGALAFPGVAAAVPAVVTTDLNYRNGPGVQHQRLGTVPGGRTVDVRGCVDGYGWCRIFWAGRSGWVSGNYLAYLERGVRRAPLPTIGFSIGVPIIRYEVDRWDRHRPRPPRWRRWEERRDDRWERRRERRWRRGREEWRDDPDRLRSRG